MRNLLLVLGLLTTLNCVGEAGIETQRTQSSEIVGGQSFTGLPAVGALLVNGSPICTGTLIEKRKVLIAAHCLEDLRGNVAFGFGPDGFNPTETIPVSSARMHPEYDTNTIQNDIGYVTLSRDASAQPMEVLTQSMDQSWSGRTMLFVGYGLSDGVNRTGGGYKRAVTMTVNQVGATQFSINDPGKSLCSGDSGGPAFWQDPVTQKLKVAGVTSYGDRQCLAYSVDTRVDAYISFLDLQPATSAPADNNSPDPVAVPTDPCQGESYEGRCSGNTVIWCEDNEVKSIDCRSLTCGFQSSWGISNCL